ncbi:MAG TPA: flagellar assembly peptidoglycan hydrolase FlgJ [Xanthomonadaceae bacterium]|jgi:flagellar protein FlgJ|nr:flagellar assembly peptidoglycan hydrolase FlgJ [Xanthomonadaceae bacterium]
MRVDARPMPLAPDARPDAARIDAVARQMEGLFAQMMVKQMRQTTLGDSMFPGAAAQFRDLHDAEIAKSLTAGRGLGLADMVARQLEREAGALPPQGKGLPITLHADGGATMRPLPADARALAALPRAEVRPLALAAPSGSTARANWIPAEAVPRLSPAFEADARRAAEAAERNSGSRASAHAGGSGSGNTRVEAFVAKVWPHAEAVARKLGVDPRAIVAQTALETGWGRSTIAAGGTDANNFFGIKATGGWRGERVKTDTQEYAGGGFVTERAAFRAYGGMAESFADYAALLKRLPRYAEAIGRGSDIRGFAEALQRGGYATDPAYARKIEAIATGPTLNRALARLGIDDASAPAAPAAARTMLAAGGFGGF